MSGKAKVEGASRDLSRQATAWLVQLDDDPEDEVLRAEFLAWLAESPAHLAAWHETGRVSNLMTAAGSLQVGRTAAPASKPPAAWGRRTGSVRALAMFAAAACVAWFAVPYAVLHVRSDEIAGTAETRVVTLQDGSRVQLAPASAIAFRDAPDGRTLNLLQGEAWFDVARDEARPFRIKAGDSTITVLGTAFSVQRKRMGTDVAVERGKVAVTTPDGGQSVRFVLEAGEFLASGDSALARGSVRPDRVASWRDGVAIVDDQSVGSVIERVRPWYNGYIIASGPGLDTRRVSGIYDLRHPDKALEALGKAHRVTVRHASPWLRIVTVR